MDRVVPHPVDHQVVQATVREGLHLECTTCKCRNENMRDMNSLHILSCGAEPFYV
jgi:hypothetical protein